MTRARATGALVAGLVVVSLGVLLVTGVSPLSAVVLMLALAIQVAGGTILWRVLAPDSDPVMELGMGIAVGTAMAVMAGLLVRLTGLGSWGWVLPGLVGCVVSGARWWRARRSGAAPVRLGGGPPVARSVWAAVVGGGALGTASLLYSLRNYPLTWDGVWSRYHPDMPFFEALATSLARFGAMESPFLPGSQVRYHWLAYAWSGQVTEAAAAGPFVVLTRILPLVAMAAGVLIVAAWARRLSTVSWVPSLAALMLLLGGYLGAVFGGVFSSDSPSQSLSVAWLLAYTIAFLHLLGAGRRRGFVLAVVGLLAFATAGGKISTAAPALAGVALVALVGLVRRESWRGAAVMGAVVTWAAAGAAFVLLMSGGAGGGGLDFGSLVDKASSAQGLNPLEGSRGVIAGTLILLVALAARWAGVAWLLADRRSRWLPSTIFGVGLALASLVAAASFNSLNELWFAAAAAGPLSAVSAAGTGEAAQRLSAGNARRGRRIAVASLLLALGVIVVVWALWLTGASGGNVWTSTWRWAGPVAGVAVAIVGGALLAWRAPRPWLLSAAAGACLILVLASSSMRLLGTGTNLVGAQENGMRNEWFSRGEAFVKGRDVSMVNDWTSTKMDSAAWLREHAQPTDLLATNLTLGPFVPGVTGLPTYASAILYAIPYGRPEVKDAILRNEAREWNFIDSPSAAAAAPLCAAGVDWVWVDPTLTKTTNWAPYAEVAFTTTDVTVLRMTCPS